MPEAPTSSRALLVALLVLVALALFSVTRLAPPARLGPDAPPARFSAARATATLRTILQSNAPHPVGSRENQAVRDRIVGALRAMGYAPLLQTASACSRYGACAEVSNVIVKIEGARSSSAVLLSAHYDSVAAGPGAADDGAGVAAILEIARALQSEPPRANTLILLFDDGEEAGLLGAEAFARQSPLARDVRVVVNLEARGTSGPSMMFETGRDNAWLVALLGEALARPVTSSLFVFVYRALPSDTDLTVFNARGWPGLNFAFIDDYENYHTRRDTPDVLDPASLQHHGDNALAVTRALMGAEIDHPPGGDAVFFDVFALGVVRWPAGWTMPLALAALLGVVLCAARHYRALRGREVAWSAVPLLGLLLGVLLSALVSKILRASGAFVGPVIAHPAPAWIGYVSLAFATVTGSAALVARRASSAGAYVIQGSLWALGAVALAALAPGASYLLVVPSLAAALAALPWASARRGSEWTTALAFIAPMIATCVVLFPPAWMLETAMGVDAFPAVTALAGLIALPLAPLVAPGGRRRFALPVAAAVVSLVSFTIAAFTPPFSRAAAQGSAAPLQEGDTTVVSRSVAL